MGTRKGTTKAEPEKALLARPPLERMYKIHQAISTGRFPNASDLAKEFEVSTKSIHRDLAFMRDNLGLPLAYDSRRWGFYYTEDVASFPTLEITEGELFALLVAEKALQQYRGTTFEKPLVSAFQKMAASLPDSVSLNLSDLDQAISFRTSAEPVVNTQVFEMLAKGVGQHKQLLIHYRKPGLPVEERLIDPYHLANINGEWFLFAYDHLRKDIRTFVPSRIQRIHFTGRRFTRPKKFSLDKTLQGSFGVHSGRETHEVVVRFSPQAADYILEKRWHPSQRTQRLRNGGVELRLQLSSLEEVQRWVLGWGQHAVVVKPPKLAAAIKQAAKEMLQNYRGSEAAAE